MKSRLLTNLDRLCLAVVLAVALGGVFFIAQTAVRQGRYLAQEKEQRNNELLALDKANRNMAALEQAIGQVRGEMASINEQIPLGLDMGALLTGLNHRMKERKIRLTVLQPQAASEEERYIKIPIRMVFQGTFSQVYHLFADMERMDRLLLPEKITLTGLEPSRECQVDMTLLVFARKTVQPGG